MINIRSLTLSSINNALKHKCKHIKIRRLDWGVLAYLYKYHVITHVTKWTNGYCIHINTSSSQKFKLIIYDRVHSKLCYSPQQITKLKFHMQETVYVFSTHLGFLTQHELIKKNLSGFLVFQITCK